MNEPVPYFPSWGTPPYRQYADLFADLTEAEMVEPLRFGDRRRLAEFLWRKGWRREVRAETWDEAIQSAYDLGYLHDWAIRDMKDRNPYREDDTVGPGDIMNTGDLAEGMKVKMPSGQVLRITKIHEPDEDGAIRMNLVVD